MENSMENMREYDKVWKVNSLLLVILGIFSKLHFKRQEMYAEKTRVKRILKNSDFLFLSKIDFFEGLFSALLKL